MKVKAIFLDRDGVLNHAIVKNGKPYPPASVDEVTIPADAEASMQALKQAGYLLIGATNQPDVPRGVTKKETVEAINQRILAALPLHEIRVCYHDDADACECRKPLPGLLLQAAEEYNIDLQQSFMIGDRWRDIEAGQKAGCKTIWLNYQYQEKSPDHPDFITAQLAGAAEWILKGQNNL